MQFNPETTTISQLLSPHPNAKGPGLPAGGSIPDCLPEAGDIVTLPMKSVSLVVAYSSMLFPKLFHSPALPGAPSIAYRLSVRLASLEAMRLLTTVGHPQPSKVTLGTWTTSVVQPLNYNCQSAPPNPGHLRLGLHMGFFPCRSTPFARERHLGPERHILHTRNILILMPVCYLFVCKCLKSGNVIFLLTIWSQMDVNIPAMLYSLWVLRALSGRQNSRICQQTYPPPPIFAAGTFITPPPPLPSNIFSLVYHFQILSLSHFVQLWRSTAHGIVKEGNTLAAHILVSVFNMF